MAYIIDRAKLWKESGAETCSLFIQNDRIDYIKADMSRYNAIRMDASGYVMTPGHVMLEYSILQEKSFPEFKKYMKKKLLAKGCTAFIAVCPAKGEKDLTLRLQEARKALLNSPIDYYLALKVPVASLTPGLIRASKRNKIPLIIIEVAHEDELKQIPWGWIREASFPYLMPIIPLWNHTENSFVRRRRNIAWQETAKAHKIATLPDFPPEHVPLPKEVLKRIGIYPHKGDIRIGGEVDYNLYELKEANRSVDEFTQLDYHRHIPKFTIHRGRPVKTGHIFHFSPGFGRECTVLKPGHFISNQFS